MKIKGVEFSIKQLIFLTLYYSLLRYLPASTNFILGKFCRKLRYHCCKHIFKYCGENVNIERKALFGSGAKLSIGNNSGIGINCVVPGDITIGNNVMMAPDCYIFSSNHGFARIDI